MLKRPASFHRGRSGLSVSMAVAFLAITLVLIVARIANTYNVRDLYRASDAGLQARQSYLRMLETGFVATGIELLLVVALIVAARRSGKDRLRAHGRPNASASRYRVLAMASL